MPWISTTLNEAMGKAISDVQSVLDTANATLSGLVTQMNQVVNNLNSVLDALTIHQDGIKASAEAGFYFIELSAHQGAWNTRLYDAENAPPNSGYSAGFATIVVAPDLDRVTTAFDMIKKALTTPLNLPNILTTNSPSSGYVPIVPTCSLSPLPIPDPKQEHPVDIWQTETVGGIFSASLSGLVQDNNLMINQAKSVLNLANQVGQRAASIEQGISTANGFLEDMKAAGAYTIVLPPGPGGYLTRLENELNAPPTDYDEYTCGICVIAEVNAIADLPNLVTQFQALQKFL